MFWKAHETSQLQKSFPARIDQLSLSLPFSRFMCLKTSKAIKPNFYYITALFCYLLIGKNQLLNTKVTYPIRPCHESLNMIGSTFLYIYSGPSLVASGAIHCYSIQTNFLKQPISLFVMWSNQQMI